MTSQTVTVRSSDPIVTVRQAGPSLAVVEYVDSDGIPGVTVIISNGCTDTRRERLRVVLVDEENRHDRTG